MLAAKLERFADKCVRLSAIEARPIKILEPRLIPSEREKL
jgi:hypothetical protein